MIDLYQQLLTVFVVGLVWHQVVCGEVIGGGRRGKFTICYAVTTTKTSASRWAVIRAILMFHWLLGARSRDCVNKPHVLKRKESWSGHEPMSSYQPSALKLSQTSSWTLSFNSLSFCFLEQSLGKDILPGACVWLAVVLFTLCLFPLQIAAATEDDSTAAPSPHPALPIPICHAECGQDGHPCWRQGRQGLMTAPCSQPAPRSWLRLPAPCAYLLPDSNEGKWKWNSR